MPRDAQVTLSDFHALQANTQYDAGFHAEHPTVRLFWEVLHSLGTEDQRRLLFFATGCDRAGHCSWNSDRTQGAVT